MQYPLNGELFEPYGTRELNGEYYRTREAD